VRRIARWTVLVYLVTALASSAFAARTRHNDTWARQQFTKAERMREALNGRRATERTRHEYQRVIDAYRRVYFGSPASSKADPSVVATAELMVEMGRRFDDNKILRSAVQQYRFLRKEYPGSKYRFDALFTIGEIYKDDLNDPEEARSTFEDFLHRYPRNRLAEEARTAVKEIDDAADKMERTARKGKPRDSGKEATASDAESVSGSNSGAVAGSNAGSNSGSNAGSSSDQTQSANVGGGRHNELPRVTGVRHWSTPDYTRVAIDVEREVKFSSSRIVGPERIFFDLRDTKLASTLVGKTFDVDDGFLKKIRVAEFQPGKTRIVFEVDDLLSYEAFLLPDPYRLIIDIHGKQTRAAMLAKTHRSEDSTTASPRAAANTSSADAEDDASDLTSGTGTQKKSEKEHAIVAKADKNDADAEDDEESAASKPAETSKAAKGAQTSDKQSLATSAVVRTTVGVKGSNVRIPKTIVTADDDAPRSGKKSARGANRKNGASETKPDSSTHATETVDDAKVTTPDTVRGRGTHADSATSTRGKQSEVSSADLMDNAGREARPTAAGDRSLTRALGLKIGKIVIDAGHGGHDTGTIGPNGLLEKDLVLDVAKRLGRLLQARLGAEVIYTRRDDTFIPLETRTAIANREQADLFISIHANSSRDSDARGVETYYLNFTSSPEALEVAARENAVSEKSVHELQDLVKKIALKEKIDESREFASNVQDSLYGGLSLSNAGIRNRGVKKAPFIVLIGANMPSILAEISFVSNPTDERKLETSEQRQKIADSLYRGVARYAGGLSGVKMASKSIRHDAQ
jgi:N-acetylmuramoyl-L-alanine amidase